MILNNIAIHFCERDTARLRPSPLGSVPHPNGQQPGAIYVCILPLHRMGCALFRHAAGSHVCSQISAASGYFETSKKSWQYWERIESGSRLNFK